MATTTVYLPLEMSSGPHCPPHCIGHLYRKSTCVVFWQDLKKARTSKGMLIQCSAGMVYAKCPECIEVVRRSLQAVPDEKKVIQVRWRPPPDIYMDLD